MNDTHILGIQNALTNEWYICSRHTDYTGSVAADVFI